MALFQNSDGSYLMWIPHNSKWIPAKETPTITQESRDQPQERVSSNRLIKLMMLLAVPVGVLNFLSDIVAGIWLAVLGEWWAIGYGIAGLFGSHFILAIAMFPSLLLAAPAAYLGKKGIRLAVLFFGFLSSLYLMAVFTIWCGAVLYFFVKEATSSSLIPLLLWSYGVATGPIVWMAYKEQQGSDGFGAIAWTFSTQVGYIVMILMVLFLRVSLLDVLIAFAAIMLIGLLLFLRIHLGLLKI